MIKGVGNLSSVLIVSNHVEKVFDLEKCLLKHGIQSTIETFENVNRDQSFFKSHQIILFNTSYQEATNIQIIKYLRQHSKWPIYALTSHEDPAIVTKYFDAGVEGFIPFHMSCELITSKIKAVKRYIDHHVYKINDILTVSGITFDLGNRTIQTKHYVHRLTLNEHQILSVLISEQNRVVSKDELISKIWDNHNSATDNALGIHISRLRKKTLTDDNIQLIETIWGVGYRLNTKAR